MKAGDGVRLETIPNVRKCKGLITPTQPRVGVFRFMMSPTDLQSTSEIGLAPTNSPGKVDKRMRLIRLLESLTQSLSPSFPDLIPHSVNVASKLRDNKFNLVVVGQFKRGKSTLVNALVGDDILPTAVVPLTSIITILRYGSEEKITVAFAGDVSEVITREQLPDFVTEKRNPNNLKKVESVHIALPCSFLEGGVQLVDTPGVGSIYAHNTDAANHFLPESDATIFLMTADQPLSIGEVEFLRNVREHVTKIFFVLNKVDMLNGTEKQEAADFIRDSLSREMAVPKDNIRLFLVSSKTALKARLQGEKKLEAESHIHALESSLMQFLNEEKSTVMVSSAARRARRIAAEASTLAKLRLKAYSESSESLRNKVDEFRKFRAEIHRRQEDISRVIYTAYNIVTMVEEDRVLFEDKTLPKLEARFDEIAAQYRSSNAPDLIDQLNKAIVSLVTEVVDKWRADEEAKVREKFNSEVKDLYGRMNELIDDVYQHAAELFDVEFQRLEEYPLFNDESEFYYFILEDIKPSLEQLSDAVVKRLPRGIARHLIVRKQKETLRIEFDRQCGRARYDIVQRIDKSMLKLGKAFSDSVNGHLARIEEIIGDAMSMREKNVSETSGKVKEYEAALHIMSRLEAEFSALEK